MASLLLELHRYQTILVLLHPINPLHFVHPRNQLLLPCPFLLRLIIILRIRVHLLAQTYIILAPTLSVVIFSPKV